MSCLEEFVDDDAVGCVAVFQISSVHSVVEPAAFGVFAAAMVILSGDVFVVSGAPGDSPKLDGFFDSTPFPFFVAVEGDGVAHGRRRWWSHP